MTRPVDPAQVARLDQTTKGVLDRLDQAAANYDHLDEHTAAALMMVDHLAVAAPLGEAGLMATASALSTIAIHLRRTRQQCTCGGQGGS